MVVTLEALEALVEGVWCNWAKSKLEGLWRTKLDCWEASLLDSDSWEDSTMLFWEVGVGSGELSTRVVVNSKEGRRAGGGCCCCGSSSLLNS